VKGIVAIHAINIPHEKTASSDELAWANSVDIHMDMISCDHTDKTADGIKIIREIPITEE